MFKKLKSSKTPSSKTSPKPTSTLTISERWKGLRPKSKVKETPSNQVQGTAEISPAALKPQFLQQLPVEGSAAGQDPAGHNDHHETPIYDSFCDPDPTNLGRIPQNTAHGNDQTPQQSTFYASPETDSSMNAYVEGGHQQEVPLVNDNPGQTDGTQAGNMGSSVPRRGINPTMENVPQMQGANKAWQQQQNHPAQSTEPSASSAAMTAAMLAASASPAIQHMPGAASAPGQVAPNSSSRRDPRVEAPHPPQQPMDGMSLQIPKMTSTRGQVAVNLDLQPDARVAVSAQGDLEQTLADEKTRMHDLHIRIKQKDSQLSSQATHLEQARLERDEARGAIAGVRKRADDLDTQIKQKDIQLSSQASDLAAAKSSEAKARRMHQQDLKKIERSDQELLSLNAIIQDLRLELETTKSRGEDLRKAASVADQGQQAAKTELVRFRDETNKTLHEWKIYGDSMVEKNNDLEARLASLFDENRRLTEDVNRLSEDGARMRNNHDGEMKSLRALHASDMSGMKTRHDGELNSLRGRHAQDVRETKNRHDGELDSVRTRHASDVRDMQLEHGRIVAGLREERRRLVHTHSQQIENKDNEMAQQAEDHRLVLATKDSEFSHAAAQHQSALKVKDEEMAALSESVESQIAAATKSDRKTIAGLRQQVAAYTKDDYRPMDDNAFVQSFQTLIQEVNQLASQIRQPLALDYDESLNPAPRCLERNAARKDWVWVRFVRSLCWKALLDGFFGLPLGYGALGTQGDGSKALVPTFEVLSMVGDQRTGGTNGQLVVDAGTHKGRGWQFEKILAAIQFKGSPTPQYAMLFQNNVNEVANKLYRTLMHVVNSHLDPGFLTSATGIARKMGILAVEMGTQRAWLSLDTCRHKDVAAPEEWRMETAGASGRSVHVDFMIYPCLIKRGDGRGETYKKVLVKGEVVHLAQQPGY